MNDRTAWSIYETIDGVFVIVVTFENGDMYADKYIPYTYHRLHDMIKDLENNNIPKKVENPWPVRGVITYLLENKGVQIGYGIIQGRKGRTVYEYDKMRQTGHNEFGYAKPQTRPAGWYREQLDEKIRELAPETGSPEEALYNALNNMKESE